MKRIAFDGDGGATRRANGALDKVGGDGCGEIDNGTPNEWEDGES